MVINSSRFLTFFARFCQCKSRVFWCFLGKSNDRRMCVVVAAEGRAGAGPGRARQHRATLPEVPPESGRKSRTLSSSRKRCPGTCMRGCHSVPKSNPSTLRHHLFRKGSRTGMPLGQRPPGQSARGDPAVSRAKTVILSAYMRAAPTRQRVTLWGHPFDEL